MNRIYLIECYFNGEINYKIGYTKRAPEKRLKELATSNPGELTILKVFESKHGRKVESFLHRHFATKRVRNEWFDLESSDVENFQALCESTERNFTTLIEQNNPFIK